GTNNNNRATKNEIVPTLTSSVNVKCERQNSSDTHKNAAKPNNLNTIFSSLVVSPTAFNSFVIISLPPGSSFISCLNFTKFKYAHVIANKIITTGTPITIHWAKLISSPNIFSYCPFKIINGGVPIKVPKPPIVPAYPIPKTSDFSNCDK